MSLEPPPALIDTVPRKNTPSLDLLKDIRVLDLTSSIAGPYAAQLLADMGATVVKVEPPGKGDDVRAWGPPFLNGESLWYLSVNRNKHSITLDHAQPEGYAIFQKLVTQADVVIVNLVPRIQRKLRLDVQTLSALNPDLIHVSLTGFGCDGERADLPCYDLVAEGYSGVMELTGEPDSPPQKIGTPAADLLAGQDAALATLAALHRRGRDGAGCAIDISMVESMTRFMSPRILSYLGGGDLPRRSGGRDSVIAIYQVFDTADKPITLALGNDAVWGRFWKAVGQPQVAQNAAFATNALRRAHRAALVRQIADLLATRPRAHWLAIFARERVPAGPIQDVHEVANDPALSARGFVYAVESERGVLPQMGLGIRFDGMSEGSTRPPPALGADTVKILTQWADVDPAHIEALRARQVV
ncbi:CaiB/BaiF CoA transferase family protein [Variovorax sp.]|jgi:crotonobetainyl-CoA:carnitine CoA-transferase CaiB-like acyl-CoA transferase|uniref:CaiB/BaiF CoA transferase family protein n=1 Tax=Variovorax sp. TaxID=1871043 RepID=UPI00403771F3